MRFHGDAASSAVEDAAVNYQSPSIIATGADAHGVSIINTLINLSLALVCYKAPALIEKAGLARRGAIILAFLNLCAWVPLTMAFFLSRLGITPGWLALLWFINLVPGLLLSVQRDNWLSNLVPRGSLGRYLGQRLAIKSAFYLGAFCFLGYLLDSLGKENLAGFTVIFTLAIAVALIDFIIFTFMSENKPGSSIVLKSETLKFSLPEYLKELKEKKLGSFITFTTLFYLTVGLSGPLYAVYMLKDLHFSYLSYTMIISAEFFARIVSVPFWGRFADKAGNIKVLSIVSRIIPLIPIFWLFGSNLGYLVLVQTISGTCWGAFDLCTQSYLFKVAPPSKKLRYIVYTRCLILMCTAMGCLLGAFCVNSIFLTFGSRILSIFWLSGLFRALVVLYMMPKLVDMAMSFGKPPPTPKINMETLDRVLVSKRGQFYRRQKPIEQHVYTRLQKTEITIASGSPRYSNRRNWVVPDNPRTPIKEPVSPMNAVNPARRLHRYYEAMAANTGKKPLITHHRLIPNMARIKPRCGLNLRAEAVITVPGKESVLSHYTIKQNIDRLNLRYNLTHLSKPLAARVEKKPVTLHQELKTDRAKAKSHVGLYQDKIGWAKYMKDTLNAILRDRQGQQVPVIISTWSGSGVPGRMYNRNLLQSRFHVVTG